ncbi:uncharacterized protein LOC142776915 [Rhipicephalus microplus]|uniref:uncharacterized protein LOC142776915 n=1 Tax=Rhipicephalus microplus TaxID=6941 RepID=UPI003F6AF60C
MATRLPSYPDRAAYHSQQAPQAQSHPCSVQETLAYKSLLVAPQAAKASQPSGAQALAACEQSNQASQSCAGQVFLDHSGCPRSTKAGEPSASQASQPLIDYQKKPLLAVQAE